MKVRVASILFTLLYVTAMLRPIIPVINYYIDYDYIVAELCENKDKPVLQCNGQCHLTKEIKKANNGVDTDKEVPPLNMKDYPIAPLYSNNTSIKPYRLLAFNKPKDTYTNTFNSTYSSFIFEPPKGIC